MRGKNVENYHLATMNKIFYNYPLKKNAWNSLLKIHIHEANPFVKVDKLDFLKYIISVYDEKIQN